MLACVLHLDLFGAFLALSEAFHRLGAVMMKILHQWLVSLNEAEHSLRSQGYIVVYGGMTSFVVPIGSDEGPPRQRGRPIWLWGAAPAALGL
jgi:hypothetical protein